MGPACSPCFCCGPCGLGPAHALGPFRGPGLCFETSPGPASGPGSCSVPALCPCLCSALCFCPTLGRSLSRGVCPTRGPGPSPSLGPNSCSAHDPRASRAPAPVSSHQRCDPADPRAALQARPVVSLWARLQTAPSVALPKSGFCTRGLCPLGSRVRSTVRRPRGLVQLPRKAGQPHPSGPCGAGGGGWAAPAVAWAPASSLGWAGPESGSGKAPARFSQGKQQKTPLVHQTAGVLAPFDLQISAGNSPFALQTAEAEFPWVLA